jgi:hypothetical protein
LVSPHSHYNLTGQRREEPVNEDIPTETQQINRFRRRDGECSEISRVSHDRKRHASARSLSTSEFLFGAIWRVGLHPHHLGDSAPGALGYFCAPAKPPPASVA